MDRLYKRIGGDIACGCEYPCSCDSPQYIEVGREEAVKIIGGVIHCSCICHVPIGGGVVHDVAYLDSCIHCNIIGGYINE